MTHTARVYGWGLLIERMRAYVGGPYHTAASSVRAVYFQAQTAPVSNGFWQLEANTDRWLLENGTGLWELQ